MRSISVFPARTILISCVLIFLPAVIYAQSIAIITHKSNTETMTLENIRNYFTGNKTHFDNGKSVLIMDLTNKNPARKVFLIKVAEMDGSAWDQHWLELKSKGGKERPKQTKSIKFIIRLISRKAGAIGYVFTDALVGKSKDLVRVVATVK